MRKVIYAGGVLAVLVAVVLLLVGQTRTNAQDRRLTVQGDLLTLVGPGSSIGITVRDSDSGVVVQGIERRDASITGGAEGRGHRHGIRWRAGTECFSIHTPGSRDGSGPNSENDGPPKRHVYDGGDLA